MASAETFCLLRGYVHESQAIASEDCSSNDKARGLRQPDHNQNSSD